mgnify:CR=1 FL=1
MEKYIRNEYGYLVPNKQHPNFKNKESDSDRYWREMEERKQQHRDWENRGEPVGF